MISPVDVANLALLKVGDRVIVSFDEATTAARILTLLYPRMLDAVLRAHRWRFAVRQVALAQLADPPVWRYAHAYALPTDPYCLKVIRVSVEEDRLAWEIQGRTLVTDASLVNIEYIARLEDPMAWDALFLEAFTERLAAELVIPLTDTPSLRQTLLQTYLLKIQEARTSDGMEGTVESRDATDLIDVR
jgi:hypothetical protein